MKNSTIPVTDEEIDTAWGFANFGKTNSKRDIVGNTLLKCACGYSTGSTAKAIVTELGLVTAKWKLTRRGQLYLWDHYSNGLSM